jgi:hypothetical protein
MQLGCHPVAVQCANIYTFVGTYTYACMSAHVLHCVRM